MRQSWTDERLDGLNTRVEVLTTRVDVLTARVDDLSRRMDAGFTRVDADLRELNSRLDTKFDALQRTLFQVGGGIVVALIGLIATQL
jgi:chaperonin cofactor prefoldin